MSQDVAVKQWSNDIIARFGPGFDVDNSDLGAGIGGNSFAVVSTRASKFRVKFNGVEELATDADGEPLASLKVVILRASRNVSKTYYEGGYMEGSDDAPTCMSVDGIKPDDGSQVKQSLTCATCQKGMWGSRITQNNKQGKACADAKRLVIVPEGDLQNERFGGPMLIRVSATALKDLQKYMAELQRRQVRYSHIITRLGFDPDASYPKLTFKPVRRLKDEEFELLAPIMADEETINNILYTPAAPRADEVEPAPAPSPAPTRAARPAQAQAAPAPAPTPAPAPVQQESFFEEEQAPAPAQKPSVKKSYAKGGNGAAATAEPAQAAAAPAAPAAPAKSAKEQSLEADLDELLSGVSL